MIDCMRELTSISVRQTIRTVPNQTQQKTQYKIKTVDDKITV